MGRLLLFFLCAGTAACRGGAPSGDPPPADPVHVETPRAPEGPPLMPPEWYDDQIEEAEREREEGRLADALQRSHAALEKRPGAEQAARLQELIQDLNREVLELPTLEGWLDAETDPIAFGDTIRVRVHLKNAGDRPVRVPLTVGTRRMRFDINDRRAPDPSSRSVFVLEVARREYDIRAQTVTTAKRVFRPLPEEINLAPGASTEFVLTVDGVGNDRPLDGFRVFTVGGAFRPVLIDVGGLRRWERVRLRACTVRSFRPNYEHLAEDPVARIGQALEKDAPVHLLTATGLVGADRRRDAVDLLVESLQGSRLMDYAMFSALHYLTDVELGRDAAAWKAWWPRVRERYFLPEPERSPEVPVFGGR